MLTMSEFDPNRRDGKNSVSTTRIVVWVVAAAAGLWLVGTGDHREGLRVMDRRTSRFAMYGGLILILAIVVAVVAFSPR